MKILILLPVVALLGACCKAGDGGEVDLTVYLKHHDRIIQGQPDHPDTVMVKYGSSEFPGSSVSDYDAIFVNVPGEDFIKIPGLKCGNYFLFGAAMDTSGPYRVIGGEALDIKYSERKEDRVIDLSVTE